MKFIIIILIIVCIIVWICLIRTRKIDPYMSYLTKEHFTAHPYTSFEGTVSSTGTEREFHNHIVDVSPHTHKPPPVSRPGVQWRAMGSFLAPTPQDKYPLKNCNPIIQKIVEKTPFFCWDHQVVTDPKSKQSDRLTPIRDQQKCGSCYMFATSIILADRIALASRGKIKTPLSVQWILDCYSDDPNAAIAGCNGGLPYEAIELVTEFGVPTEEEYPYVSGETGTSPGGPCKTKSDEDKKHATFRFVPDKEGAPQVVNLCDTSDSSGQQQPYNPSNPPKLTPQQMKDNVMRMKCELFERGPIIACYAVYEDFQSYDPKKDHGVYAHNPASQIVGGHAVVVVGWDDGDDSVLPHWIVKNSWGPNWGMDGYFFIRMNTNESLFESYAVAGVPDCTEFGLKDVEMCQAIVPMEDY